MPQDLDTPLGVIYDFKKCIQQNKFTLAMHNFFKGVYIDLCNAYTCCFDDAAMIQCHLKIISDVEDRILHDIPWNQILDICYSSRFSTCFSLSVNIVACDHSS